jgi:hypothetical protein
MRSMILWGVILFCVGRSYGDDFFGPGLKSDPNHLVPIHSFMYGFLGDYDWLLAEHLFVTEGKLGRMLVRPPFSSEFCLSVDAEHIEPSDKKDARTAAAEERGDDRYAITVTTAAESIWKARHKVQKDGKPMHVKIERIERKIGRDLAVAIQRVWAKVLLLTRYPAPTPVVTIGFDRTTYQFSVVGPGTLEGETRSPTQGLPLELTNVGLDLVAFARQDTNGKKMTEEQLIDRLRKLESTIPQR